MVTRGRKWRATIAEAFDIEGGEDFDCPMGKAWDYKETPPAKSNGLGDTVKKAIEATGMAKMGERLANAVTGGEDCGCKARQAALNAALPYKKKPTVLVMRREVNRKEVLDVVRDALAGDFDAIDVEIPFTLDAIKAECEKRGNVVAIIRAEEHGLLFVNNNWRKACAWAHTQKIKMLHVDFGYFDHYASRLIGEYGPDGEPVMSGWGDRIGKTDDYILQHFERVAEAGSKAKEAGSPYPFPYVVVWTGCHAALARKPFRAPKSEWLTKCCGEILERCALPVIKDSPLSSFTKPAGVEVVTGRDLDENARLAIHAHNNIIVNSSVSNELVLWSVPVTALGRSWYDGKGVFHEAKTWLDAVDPMPIDFGARADWVDWWINNQTHADGFAGQILGRVKDGNSLLAGNR